jgi:hypothetical protein
MVAITMGKRLIPSGSHSGLPGQYPPIFTIAVDSDERA